jgi:hypothetical protein
MICISIGSQYRQQDVANNTGRNITPYLEQTLFWNSTKYAPGIVEGVSNGTKIDFSNSSNMRIRNVVIKTADYVGYCMFEVAKWGIEYGYTSTNIDAEKTMSFLKIAIYVLIIGVCFYPICIAGYIVFLIVKWIISKVRR